MGYHIFLAGENSFNVCVERGVYGGAHAAGTRKSKQMNSEVVASFASIRVGDFVFFYVKGRGIYGLWRVTQGPFYDTERIWSETDQIYPYRVCFEPAVRRFSNPIAISDILDLRDKGKVWTFDLGTIMRKSHFPITSDEGKELIRLLLRNNPVYIEPGEIPNPYRPRHPQPLPLSLEQDRRGRLRYEGYLNAWFMRAFAAGKLKELIGDYADFLNFVPTTFNTVMDVFLTHVTKVGSMEILHKFTCMELKTGLVKEEDLRQVIRYESWLTRKLADGDSEMVQSILVGFDFDPKVVSYCAKRKTIDEKTVRLIKYRVDPQGNDLILEEVDLS